MKQFISGDKANAKKTGKHTRITISGNNSSAEVQ